MAQTWRLRRGEMDDLDSLHALATIPRVYRYLFDGEPPSREYIAQRLALRISDSPVDCFGLWFLQDGPHHYVDVSSCDPTKSRERQRSPWCYIQKRRFAGAYAAPGHAVPSECNISAWLQGRIHPASR